MMNKQNFGMKQKRVEKFQLQITMKYKLPKTCCSVTGKDQNDNIIFCDELAKHWYIHNNDICSYCEEHNYVCGEEIILSPKPYLNHPMLIHPEIRIRRGKIVQIPIEWRGNVTFDSTKRKRKRKFKCNSTRHRIAEKTIKKYDD